MPPKKKQKKTGGHKKSSAKPPPPEIAFATQASPNTGKTKKVTCGGKEYLVVYLDDQVEIIGLQGTVTNPHKNEKYSYSKEYLCVAGELFGEEFCLCNKFMAAYGNRKFRVKAVVEGEVAEWNEGWLCANCQQNCELLNDDEKRELVPQEVKYSEVNLTTGDNKTIARLGPGSCVTFAEQLSGENHILIRVKDPPTAEEMANEERQDILFKVSRKGKRRGSKHLACQQGKYQKVYESLMKCQNVAAVWGEIVEADGGYRFYYVITALYMDGTTKVSFVPHVDKPYMGKPEKRSNWTVYMKKVEDESDYKIMRFQDRKTGWWFDIVCTHGTIVEQSKYASGIHVKDENGFLMRSPIVHAVFNADGTCTITWDHGKKCDGTYRGFTQEEMDAALAIDDDQKSDGEYSDDEDSEGKKPAHLKDDSGE